MSLENQYYAKLGNSFWKILHKVGLTPTLFSPDQLRDLLSLKIGLTDISKAGKGMDKDIKKDQFDVIGFREKIEEFQPLVLCFNGKKAAKVFFNK
jgi:TDG/mug DNA glycosylase family protein